MMNDFPAEPSAVRNRPRYLLFIFVTTVSGLIWRSRLIPLTPFMSKYGGDALWALMVFFGFGFLFTRISTVRLSLVSLGFAWAIEFSQLYRTPWFDAIRATRPGHLVFGSTFNWPDLPAYAVGIALGALLEIWSAGVSRRIE
jgi:hypothetical protein